MTEKATEDFGRRPSSSDIDSQQTDNDDNDDPATSSSPAIPLDDFHLTPLRTSASHASRRNLAKTNTRASTRSRTYGGHDGYSVFDADSGSESAATAGVASRPASASASAPAVDDDVDDETARYLVAFDDVNTDPFSPRRMSTLRKWFIVVLLASTSLLVTCTSSLYTSTYGQIMPEFGSSREVATLGLSLYVMGLGVGPMALGPLSEFYGRRPVYIWSLLLFVIWLIPEAVATNMATMLVGRFFNGVAGSGYLSVAGGSVGDMFDRSKLSAPMMLYTASPFIG
jgi:hypothetical protein